MGSGAQVDVAVTGATGLVGSNLCRLLVDEGRRVRALVRASTDCEPLEALGVEVVRGDMTDAAAVRRLVNGSSAVVHAAAVLGGVAQDAADQQRVNVDATADLLDAAVAADVATCIVLSTASLLGSESVTVNEDSPPADRETVSNDPYRHTKLAALAAVDEQLRRGADVRVVFPGGVFGPAPCVESAMRATSFNRILRGALRGRLPSAITYSASWVYVDDVASGTIGAIDRGAPGAHYLLVGRPEDEMSTAAWCNRAAALAGISHRVEEVPATDDPALVEWYGPTLVELGRRRSASPRFDISRTIAELGYAPRPVDDGLARTIAWFRQLGYI